MKSPKSVLLLLFLCAGGPAAQTTPGSVEALAPEKCRGMVEIPAGEFFYGDDHAPAGRRLGPEPSMATTGRCFMDKFGVTWR